MEGQLGVVSGTALDTVLARQLQLGDPGGHLRRALKSFPLQDAAGMILKRYFIASGKGAEAPFRPVPLPSLKPSEFARSLVVAGAFVFVYLAKEGHSNPVGINLLEKIQPPTLSVLYGAMLAGVDVVLMGAGIPRSIPGILDHFAAGQAATLRIDALGARQDVSVTLDPKSLVPDAVRHGLTRPKFLAIVSAPTLARHLMLKASGKVDGLVVEGPTAGGHNAPPRGGVQQLSASGEPIYGAKDQVNLEAFRSLGLPFWLAGGYGRRGGLQSAQAEGAVGIQVGTAFAFCEESGLDSGIKAQILHQASKGAIKVFTDPHASPTGFPFKIVPVEGSLSDPEVYQARCRICDVGLLREVCSDNQGNLTFRCPAEPETTYQKKGGNLAQTAGRQCLCNGLLATIGLGQVRSGGTVEPALVTAGDNIGQLDQFLQGRTSYRAKDVLHLLAQVASKAEPQTA